MSDEDTKYSSRRSMDKMIINRMEQIEKSNENLGTKLDEKWVTDAVERAKINENIGKMHTTLELMRNDLKYNIERIDNESDKNKDDIKSLQNDSKVYVKKVDKWINMGRGVWFAITGIGAVLAFLINKVI